MNKGQETRRLHGRGGSRNTGIAGIYSRVKGKTAEVWKMEEGENYSSYSVLLQFFNCSSYLAKDRLISSNLISDLYKITTGKNLVIGSKDFLNNLVLWTVKHFQLCCLLNFGDKLWLYFTFKLKAKRLKKRKEEKKSSRGQRTSVGRGTLLSKCYVLALLSQV